MTCDYIREEWKHERSGKEDEDHTGGLRLRAVFDAEGILDQEHREHAEVRPEHG